MDVTKQYYTIKEIAQYFSVSYNAIRQEMINGLLNYSKIGGSYRISLSDLEEYRRIINARSIENNVCLNKNL